MAVDASMAHDQMKELEKTVDHESLMKERFACESVYSSKISKLEILGLPVELLDSGKQTALTRAKATLLMKKTMLERVANEQEARKESFETGRGTKDTIVERHVHDETVRIVEDGGRRQSSKFAEKLIEPESDGKGKTKRLTLRSCTAFCKTTVDPCPNIRLNK